MGTKVPGYVGVVAHTYERARSIIRDLGLTDAYPISTCAGPATAEGLRLRSVLVDGALSDEMRHVLSMNLLKTRSGSGGLYQIRDLRP